ncbi:L,D-transpeptidase [Pedobacter frigoris]|uniref:L,D-transpeptidase n=2 Tax=Pedobacter frigoris TaxID=2571272 RepID=A0A4U1CG82_9SPHI|nr:L,D-transpeptidase [Pedobacter frigoris]
MVLLVIGLQACRKSRSEIGKELFKETRNSVFKKIENDAFAEVFKQVLQEQRSSLKNPKLISAFYEKNEYEPALLLKYLPEDQMKVFSEYLNQSAEHGLDSKLFQAAEVDSLLKKIYDKKAIKTVEEASRYVALLELRTANSLINYSNALQYGLISPRRIYAQYYTETARPDSTSMNGVLATKGLKVYLDSIQPKGASYVALQKALKEGITTPGMSKEQTQRVLQVNLERLRWKNRKEAGKMVVVNIPDFHLDVIEGGKSVLGMKVCVGEAREANVNELREYDESDLKKDRPFSRETPQLGSVIHSVQVNPIWNIPQSIATNEISKYAAADRYYLANNNIDVYKDGELVQDTELIDWTAADAGKVYKFKQRPGDDNSLGKIKFLFDNQSSVYLHDTPAKAAFNQSMRAVSHGCVRVEKPLELARALFGEGSKFEFIKKQMENKDNPEAKDLALPKKVPVYLTYYTCWTDANGTLQFRKDIYGQDVVLYSYLQKMGA